jgi:hypothetical protein
VDPVFGVNATDVGIGGGFRAEKVAGFGDAVVEEFVVDQAKFFGRENVGAEIEVVAFVVDEFEGKHGGRKRSIDLRIEEKTKSLTQSSERAAGDAEKRGSGGFVALDRRSPPL